ncbi:MAG: hypothetical protein R3Y26_11570 [Rikenellaceae bacterium]
MDTQTTKTPVFETPAETKQKDQFYEWYDKGRIKQADMIDIVCYLINLCDRSKEPQPEKVVKLKPIYLNYQKNLIDWDTYCDQTLKILDGESITETETKEITEPLSPENRQALESIGAFLMNDRLETLNSVDNPNMNELWDLAFEMRSLIQTFETFATPNQQHNNNIATVFGNYFANNGYNSEQKTEMLHTQQWLLNNFNVFYKKAYIISDIADLTGNLCEMLDKYYDDKDINA